MNLVWLRFEAQDSTAEDTAEFKQAFYVHLEREFKDQLRRRQRAKRGPDVHRVPIDEQEIGVDAGVDRAVDVRLLMDRLHEASPELALVFLLRRLYLFTIEESGEILGLTRHQVDARDKAARAWLYDALKIGSDDDVQS